MIIQPTKSTSSSLALIVAVAAACWIGRCDAAVVTVTNPGFEDISGESPFNEFTFGPLNGWGLYDPGGITNGGAGGTYYIGTLTPNPPTNFTNGASEGQRVAIAFNFFGSGGQGEYGLQQTLTETLQANTSYSLQVDIGNIASGTAQNGQFFNLDGFSGYRVDLLAGGVLLAQDNNSLFGAIAEGQFGTSVVNFNTGTSHAQLGETLQIRLVNLNQVDPSFPLADLEVDFDNVRLNASAVPEPSSIAVLGCLVCGWALRRRHRATSFDA
ncbi:PEP-CTERM sorting domain-containing protein [Neorhodopirellula pilleata]|uniref:PEP-CTERM protein-sorting domain-containing protein n=1 Tax=Neorhodopirellula pilleata TaxID=2714738 RepID=A0A5C6ARA8_9BACT|nr:PEP-CTERM sorting domain-containing protein [Neorhodopirellula pilleata]TWU02037.1 hypothetical protein Pla100_17730 [Neorhodopirellula pilleata]